MSSTPNGANPGNKGDNMQNLPARTMESGPDMESFAKSQPLQPGVYWKSLREVNNQAGQLIPAGTVLLLKELRCVEDEVHTAILHPHPLDRNRKNHRFLVRDFLDLFEPEYNAEAIRREELAEVQREIEEAQRQLLEGQANPALLLPDLADNPEFDAAAGLPGLGEDTTALVDLAMSDPAQQAERLNRQAKNQEILARSHANWIKEKTQNLQETISKVAPFYTEKSQAALAACSDAIDQATAITEGIKTLDLFTGKDVDVITLCQGTPAPAGEKLTLFQRKLFLDEEYLVHLADGGADFRDLEEFGKTLQEDPDLLQRILPTPRSVVAMAYRRRDKDYGATDLPSALESIAKNEANRRTFLLIRNGGNVHMVFSGLATDNSPRLFPTTDDMDRPFKGFDGSRITFRDVRFTDSLNQHDRVALHYKRLLVLLWGLHDREGLLGEFASQSPLNFLNLGVQAEWFRFVHDDEKVLGEGRKPWHEWVKEKNRYLQSGSRVACLWRQVMTPQTCAFVKHDRGYHGYDWTANPVEPFGLKIAARREEEIHVKAPVTRTSWNSNRERIFEATINLSAYKEGAPGFLVLDAVRAEDLDFYIFDRTSRHDYLNYIDLLISARNLLREDEAHEADMREKLHEGLVDGRLLPAGEPLAAVEEELREAIRAWRVSRRGKRIPSRSNKDFIPVYQALLDHLYVLIGAGRDRVAGAAAAAEAEGRTPVRLVVTGRNTLVLYATPLPEERIDQLGGHVWLQRIVLEPRQTKFSPVRRGWSLLPEFDAAETLLHEWPDASNWKGLKAPSKITYEQARTLLGRIEAAGEHLARFTPPLTDEAFNHWFEELRTWTGKLSRGGYVHTPMVTIPFGLIRKEERSGREVHEVLAVSEDLTNVLGRRATPEQRHKLVRWLVRTYAHPETHVEQLDKSFGIIGTLSLSQTSEESMVPGPYVSSTQVYNLLTREHESLEKHLANMIQGKGPIRDAKFGVPLAEVKRWIGKEGEV